MIDKRGRRVLNPEKIIHLLLHWRGRLKKKGNVPEYVNKTVHLHGLKAGNTVQYVDLMGRLSRKNGFCG